MKKIIVFILICAMSLSILGLIPASAVASADTDSGYGDLIASFHVIYDTHVPRDTAAYQASLKNMSSINSDTSIALVIGGDNTVNTELDELDVFYGLLDAHNPVSKEETVVILGNHDVRGPNDGGNWQSDPTGDFPFWETAKERYKTYNKDYMPEEAQQTIYHKKVLGGYTFIALNTELGLKDQMYMSDEYLAWFEETMKEAYEADPTKPIFVICHQAMQDTIWRTWEYGLDHSGFKYTTGLDAKVQKILEKYPTAIFISGHMHNELVNIEPVLRPYASFIDVPANYKDDSRPRAGGLGYEAEIYSDKVVFRAVNFAKNEWYPDYDLVVPTMNGGISAVYQTAKKQMEAAPENFDDTDKWLLETLEGMLTKKYSASLSREEQFYYTDEDIKDICHVAEQVKKMVGAFPGDTLAFKSNEVKLYLDSGNTIELSVLNGNDTVRDKHLVWTSSDENIVKVIDGKLTAVAVGTATVTAASAYDSSVKTQCTVSVAATNDTANDPEVDTGNGETGAVDGTDTELPPDDVENKVDYLTVAIISASAVAVAAIVAAVVVIVLVVKKKKK